MAKALLALSCCLKDFSGFIFIHARHFCNAWWVCHGNRDSRKDDQVSLSLLLSCFAICYCHGLQSVIDMFAICYCHGLRFVSFVCSVVVLVVTMLLVVLMVMLAVDVSCWW